MAFITLQATMMYPSFGWHSQSNVLGYSISASGKVAMVFQAPATGSISSIAFFVDSLSVTTTFIMQLMNVNEATNPDGTIDQQVTFSVATGAGRMLRSPKITTDGLVGSAGRSVTKGELFACVISTQLTTRTVLSVLRVGNNRMAHEPRARAVTQSIGAATWINTGEAVPIYALNYKNLGWVNNGMLNVCSSNNEFTISAAAVPDEIGVAFMLRAPMLTDGFYFANRKSSVTGTILVALYDAPNGTTTLTAVEVRTVGGQTSSHVVMTADFGGHFTLSSSTTYFIGIRNLSGLKFVGMNHEFSLTDITAASPFGENYWQAQRTDVGAWTIVKDRIPFSSIRVTGFSDDVVGGGGGTVMKSRIIGSGI